MKAWMDETSGIFMEGWGLHNAVIVDDEVHFIPEVVGPPYPLILSVTLSTCWEWPVSAFFTPARARTNRENPQIGS